MREISRDPLDLVSQTIGRHHQYPDGLVLFMGTLFAPVEDRDAPGQGFTHKIGDVVTIANTELGVVDQHGASLDRMPALDVRPFGPDAQSGCARIALMCLVQ
jgi:fumarylacetoacetate (FAA) hydrolase family protein